MDWECPERGLTGEGKVLKVGLPGQGFHEGKVQLGGPFLEYECAA